MRLLLWLSLVFCWSCAERYTPWGVDVPSEYSSLTDRNLKKLAALPAATYPLKIALLGDPQGTPQDLESVIEVINLRTDIRMILVLGDLTDYGLMHEYVWAARSLENAHVPNLSVIGNHDAIAHGKKIYERMFGPFDYVFSDAGLKFVMFNNNQFEFGTTDFDWLKSQIDSSTIVSSHVPPAIDMHTAEQIDAWTSINAEAKIITSLHGHRGSKTDFLQMEKKIPYYVVPKVDGVRYSILTIDEDHKLGFELCTPECRVSPW